MILCQPILFPNWKKLKVVKSRQDMHRHAYVYISVYTHASSRRASACVHVFVYACVSLCVHMCTIL